jgi:2-methylisocitrate lyase-like PEP mutase family enzyme
MRRPSIREALARETPLVTPLAHDALSARMIEQAGFKASRSAGPPCWRRGTLIPTLA